MKIRGARRGRESREQGSDASQHFSNLTGHASPRGLPGVSFGCDTGSVRLGWGPNSHFHQLPGEAMLLATWESRQGLREEAPDRFGA